LPKKIFILLHLLSKDLRRKSSIAVFILLIVSSFFVSIVIRNLIIYTEADEYWDLQMWPTEIIVHPLGDVEDFPVIEEAIREIEGVKWTVYPAKIYFSGKFRYQNRSYYLELSWCNVEDITFPHPKFIVRGRFFESNYENSVIIESIGEQLLKDIGEYKGIGENKTMLDLGVASLPIVGVITNQLMNGREEAYLDLTDIIAVYAPLGTYLKLYKAISQLNFTERAELKVDFEYAINVKVKEGYDIDMVANRIKSKYPHGVVVETVTEYEKSYHELLVESTLYPTLIGYILSVFIMIWEIRRKTNEISLLKVLGWRRNDILKFFIMRYTIFGIISSILGLSISLLLSSLIMFSIPNLYMIYLFFVVMLPIQICIATSLTVISSLPAIIKAYNVSAEKVLRV